MTELDGAERVGTRISPGSNFNDVVDEDPYTTYSLLLKNLSKFNLAYVHIVGKAMNLSHKPQFNAEVEFDIYKFARKYYSGLIIGNSGFEFTTANKAIVDNEVDLVSFGRKYIANPDLVERFRNKLPLSTANPDTFYTSGYKGFSDYNSW